MNKSMNEKKINKHLESKQINQNLTYTLMTYEVILYDSGWTGGN